MYGSLTRSSILTDTKYRSNLVGNQSGAGMQLIETITVPSGGSTSINFNNIPQGFTNLQLLYSARSSGTGSIEGELRARYNADSGNNYTKFHWLYYGNGAMSHTQQINLDYAYLGWTSGGGTTSTIFGIGVVDILDYSSSTKNKTTRSHTGIEIGTNGYAGLNSTLWYSQNPITSITLFTNNTTLQEYSIFSLYGWI